MRLLVSEEAAAGRMGVRNLIERSTQCQRPEAVQRAVGRPVRIDQGAYLCGTNVALNCSNRGEVCGGLAKILIAANSEGKDAKNLDAPH